MDFDRFWPKNSLIHILDGAVIGGFVGKQLVSEVGFSVPLILPWPAQNVDAFMN